MNNTSVHPNPPTHGTWRQASQAPATINGLCDAAESWAQAYYQKPTRDGSRRPTREHAAVADALAALRGVAGNDSPDDICAEMLMACQDWMVARGYCRTLINSRINRIRRICKWAAQPPRRWLRSDIEHELRLVQPLKKGRTEAHEREPIASVSWEHVSDTLSHAPLQLATMIELQWWTGMRPNELVGIDLAEHLPDMLLGGDDLRRLEQAVAQCEFIEAAAGVEMLVEHAEHHGLEHVRDDVRRALA